MTDCGGVQPASHTVGVTVKPGAALEDIHFSYYFSFIHISPVYRYILHIIGGVVMYLQMVFHKVLNPDIPWKCNDSSVEMNE